MNDLGLRKIQIAIEGCILVCMIFISCILLTLLKTADEEAWYSDKGIAVRVINSDRSPVAVKVSSGSERQKDGRDYHNFNRPLPVKIYTGVGIENNEIVEQFDTPIPVRVK